MKPILAVAMCLSLVACMGGGGRRPSTSPARPSPSSPAADSLRGQWNLTSIQTQGQPRRGSGHASIDEFNNIVLRAEIDPSEPGITPPRTIVADFTAKVQPSGNELNYVGVQQRAPADQLVSNADPSAWRHFSIDGDTLRIWLDGQAGTMVFQRAR